METTWHQVALTGNMPSPINHPKGRRFCPRCKYARENCIVDEPERWVAYHY